MPLGKRLSSLIRANMPSFYEETEKTSRKGETQRSHEGTSYNPFRAHLEDFLVTLYPGNSLVRHLLFFFYINKKRVH